MPAAFRVTPKLSEVPPNCTSAGLRENFLENDDEDGIRNINDVESLKKGIIKTSKNSANRPYTILLVGETGVGKSSLLEFIANVLAGNDIDNYNFDILARTNELGGPNHQSQTNSAKLYEFTSQNGIVVRILDTPGLADIRSIQQDGWSVATQDKGYVSSIIAVLIVVDGSATHVTVDALSTLSDIVPKSLANNIAVVFTNVSSPLHWNFSRDTVHGVLKEVPHFLLNNPVALQKQYLKLKNSPNYRTAVKAGEENALNMLVDLFDWLDGLEPQPTTEIDRAPTAQRAAKGAKRSATVKMKCTSNHTLEQSKTDRDVSQAQMRGGLVQMLALLKKAEGKMQKGIRKVLWIFFGK